MSEARIGDVSVGAEEQQHATAEVEEYMEATGDHEDEEVEEVVEGVGEGGSAEEDEEDVVVGDASGELSGSPTDDSEGMAKMEGVELEKKQEFKNLPKLGDEPPDFTSKSADDQREWLKHHGVKGTWQKKLLQKCVETWEDMMTIVRERSGADLCEHDHEEPNFADWSLERKRAFLRRRDVKGIWSKYVDEKCQEIWRLERAGEKYVHTPPSLGRHTKARYPGQSVILSPMQSHLSGGLSGHVISDENLPMTISPADFQELAGAAQKSDLKRVTDLLNHWSSKNMLPEEAPPPPTPPSGAIRSPNHLHHHHIHHHHIHHLSEDQLAPMSATEPIEYRWVTETGTPKASGKRNASPHASGMGSPGMPSAKRRKGASGVAMSPEAAEFAAMPPEVLVEEMMLLQHRLRELEAQNQQLIQENHALKTPVKLRK